MSSAYDIPFWSKDFYDHKARWIHYYNQIRAVAGRVRNSPDKRGFKVLEVGPSHGQVTSYLRKFGVDVTTIDNKKEYSPNILGDVLKMPFKDDNFDMVLVCEVLEHLPYEQFLQALVEIKRVVKLAVFLSLPDSRKTLLSFSLKVPFLKEKKFILKVHAAQTIPSVSDHKFEIGMKDFPLKKILKDIENVGFKCIEHTVSVDTPKNHYFLLSKV